MVDRRQFLLFAAVAGASALAAAGPRRVVVFAGVDDRRADQIRRAWVDWFAADGYADGVQVRVELVNAGLKDDPGREEALARQVVASRPAVVCVPGGWMGLFAGLTREVPLVFRLVDDPVASGWAASLSRPGRNITGITSPYGPLFDKRIELLKELKPSLRRIAMVGRLEGHRAGQEERRKSLAASLSIEIMPPRLTLAEMNDPEAIVAAARDSGADALNVAMIDDVVPQALLEHCRRQAVPAIFDEIQTVERGGLACLGEAVLGTHRRSYRAVLKIVRGDNPGDIAIDQQAEFHLALNLATAKAMRLEIPAAVRIRSNQLVGWP
jgi:putative ABC transport system substrate-binding protein